MKRRRILAALLGLCMLPVIPAAQAAAAGTPGDVDGSGEVGLLDAVCLQKWLLGAGKMAAPENADVNEDNSVDIFDLGTLKQWLIYGVKPVYVSENLSRNVKSAQVKGQEADEAFTLAQTGFALGLLKETAEDGTNTLISPYSVMQAFGMTTNGADGNTLAEMEQALGGIPIESLNRYLYTQRSGQPDDEYCKLLTANAIWVRTGYPVSEKFLQTNADYYGADVYSGPFDETTVRDVNKWTDNHTDHMIPHLIDEFGDNERMALINAVTFDAKWMSPYDSEWNVHDGTFTAADGTRQKAQMMSSEEHSYLKDEHADGFLKYYEGGRYAFAALLPEEGMTTSAYIDTLTAEGFRTMLENVEHGCDVNAQLPKFSYSYDTMLNDAMQNMGMKEAFTRDADFSRMHQDGDSDLYIGRVLHKTFISVTEEGTRAAAVTAILMEGKGMPMEVHTVILDRPFVYAIVDTQTNLPVFIGTVETLE